MVQGEIVLKGRGPMRTFFLAVPGEEEAAGRELQVRSALFLYFTQISRTLKAIVGKI